MNFDNIVEQLKDQIIQSTQEIIRIPSIKKEPLPGKPFGEEVHQSLEYMLALGRSMGFRTKNLDGYIGYVEFGEGKELIGILAHLDVVPEGTGWTYPPYGGEIHDDKIYGRGTIDDKGPAVAALYAMKAVKDSGAKLNKRIRLILGLDEESGWSCMEYYLKHEEVPSCAFTPDANYPVIHAEKGVVNYILSKQFDAGHMPFHIIAIKGGNRPNMVPDYCEVVIEAESHRIAEIRNMLNTTANTHHFPIDLEMKGNRITLKSYGKSAHGSTPEKGVNAISQAMIVLGDCLKNNHASHEFIDFYTHCIGLETNGSSIGCALHDDVSGMLTLNVGLIDMSENAVKLTVNIRYPVTYKEQDIYTRIHHAVKKYHITLEKGGYHEPLHIPKDHPLVQKLMKVYNEVTGDNREPIAIGGGTYARSMNNAVAFGAIFPGEPELAHEKDEYISIESLMKNTKIFARAIYELGI